MISFALYINSRMNDLKYFVPYGIFELPKMSTDCLNDPSADNDMFLND